MRYNVAIGDLITMFEFSGGTHTILVRYECDDDCRLEFDRFIFSGLTLYEDK